ncbi:unnamed protein product [Bursaphelenchus okinawaensis]|uniref:PDZ domain-containing protein n=1 Tax=Bursaphelenchus okinawaensis TaxID=465554 RepID=A0A811K0L4_9BILA|nr:unnamed protein product [Bursaphelenchus okinawaensis]CAG9088672.1 unnamed protein product [Bursaphelenchus okinawaensis]
MATDPFQKYLNYTNYTTITETIEVQNFMDFSLTANMIVKSIAVNSSAMELLIIGDQLVRVNQDFVWTIQEAESLFNARGKFEIQVLRQAYKKPLKYWRSKQCNFKRTTTTNCFVVQIADYDEKGDFRLYPLAKKGTFEIEKMACNSSATFYFQLNDVVMDLDSVIYRTPEEFMKAFETAASSNLKFSVAVYRPDDVKMPLWSQDESEKHLNWPTPSDCYLIGQREALRFNLSFIRKEEDNESTTDTQEMTMEDDNMNAIVSTYMTQKRNSRPSPVTWSTTPPGGKKKRRQPRSRRKTRSKLLSKDRRLSPFRQRIQSLRRKMKKQGSAVIDTKENEEEQVRTDVREGQKLHQLPQGPGLGTRMMYNALNLFRRPKYDPETCFPAVSNKMGSASAEPPAQNEASSPASPSAVGASSPGSPGAESPGAASPGVTSPGAASSGVASSGSQVAASSGSQGAVSPGSPSATSSGTRSANSPGAVSPGTLSDDAASPGEKKQKLKEGSEKVKKPKQVSEVKKVKETLNEAKKPKGSAEKTVESSKKLKKPKDAMARRKFSNKRSNPEMEEQKTAVQSSKYYMDGSHKKRRKTSEDQQKAKLKDQLDLPKDQSKDQPKEQSKNESEDAKKPDESQRKNRRKTIN